MCRGPALLTEAPSPQLHRACNRSNTSREMAVGQTDGLAAQLKVALDERGAICQRAAPHPQSSVNRQLHHFGGLRGIERDRKSINRRVHQNYYRARAAHCWTGGFNAQWPTDRQQSLLKWQGSAGKYLYNGKESSRQSKWSSIRLLA